MLKTKEELKEQVKKIGLEFWRVHDCSMCGYPCGYVFQNERVGYDSGCDCTYQGGGIEPRSWEDLEETFNLNQPENNPNIGEDNLKKLYSAWQF